MWQRENRRVREVIVNSVNCSKELGLKGDVMQKRDIFN